MSAAGASKDTRPASSWPGRLLVAIGFAAISIAHWPLLTYDPGAGILEGIEEALFESASASPGIVMICWLCFLYMRWPRLRGFEGQHSPLAGTLLFFLGASLCVWAHYVAADTLLVFSISVLSLACGLLFGGVGALRTLLFPAAFLFLAIPVPTPVVNFIMYPLQLANAAAAGTVLSLIGIETVVSGDLIFAGDQLFQVIESCSGFRTVLVVIMSACLYTQLTWHDRRRTLALIAFSPFVGLFANHVRILTIILNPYADIAGVHTAQGLLMAVFAVILIALLDLLLARVWKTAPEARFPVEVPTGRLPLSLCGIFAMICTSLAITSLSVTPWSPTDEEPVALVRIKADLPNWNLTGFKPDSEFLGTVRFDEFIAHRYQHGDEPPVDLLLASDRHLDPLLGLDSAKTVIPGRGGALISKEAARESNVDTVIVRMPSGLQLVYHWRVGFASLWQETIRSFFALDRSPLRRPGRSAFVRLSTPIESVPTGRVDASARLGILMDALRDDFLEVGVGPTPGS